MFALTLMCLGQLASAYTFTLTNRTAEQQRLRLLTNCSAAHYGSPPNSCLRNHDMTKHRQGEFRNAANSPWV